MKTPMQPVWRTIKIDDEGLAHVRVSMPFGTSKIVVAMQEHTFERGQEKGNPLPAGIFYMRSPELSRRTGGRTTHVRYDNLYALLRAHKHITRSQGAEIHLLDLTRADIRALADFVRISRGMGSEEVTQVVDHLQALGDGLLPPKRRPEKIRAGQQLGKSARLREEGTQRIAPSARTAYAAATHVDRRIKHLNGMYRFFTWLDLAIWQVIQSTRMTVHRAWTYFAKAPLSSDGGNPLASIPAILKVLPEYLQRFEELRYRPYRDLAELFVLHLRWFQFEIVQADKSPAGRRYVEMLNVLRRMRVIDRVELNIIGPIAYHLDLPKKRRDDAAFIATFSPLLTKAHAWLKKTDGSSLTPDVAAEVLPSIANAILLLNGDEPNLAAAKDALVAAVSAIASVPKNVRPPYPHAQGNLALAS